MMTELNSLAEYVGKLSEVLNKGLRKHSPYMTLNKGDIIPLLANVEHYLSEALNAPKPCLKCPYWREAEDRRVAELTIERLRRNPESGVTPDEAENLSKVLSSIPFSTWDKAV